MLNNKLIYLHGSHSDSNSGKARLFRERSLDACPRFHMRIRKPYNSTSYRRIARASARNCRKTFANLTCHIVEDDHRLHKTVHELDWNTILT